MFAPEIGVKVHIQANFLNIYFWLFLLLLLLLLVRLLLFSSHTYGLKGVPGTMQEKVD